MYQPGDMVRIRSGVFASFTARVETVFEQEELVEVIVKIFGRATPIQLKFRDVEKLRPKDDTGGGFLNN